MELNPQVVFERMFGDGSTAEQRAARRKRDRSILDSLTGSLSRLRSEVSAADRARLDDYARGRPRDRAPAADRDEGLDRRAGRHRPCRSACRRSFDEHIKLQFDLLALAFQADITRVGTLLFARDLTGRTYPESEAPTVGFHGVSHHGEDPRRIARVRRRSTSTTSRCWRTSSTSWRRRRTATARCSIIRWCSTAATWGTRISTCTTTCRTC